MILFNLGEGLKSYIGLDPSAAAVSFVRKAAESVAWLAGKVNVQVGTAQDTCQLPLGNGPGAELVVLNSVVQYFPTAEYLSGVVDDLTRIPGVKKLFFGDIRSFALHKEFVTKKALCQLGEKGTKEEFKKKVADLLHESEEELLVDPAFFTDLTRSLSDRVAHVEILPKRMDATNELSAYRYAAVVHIRSPAESQDRIHSIEPDSWVDFHSSQMDRQALEKLLQNQADTGKTMAISNIPNSKTVLERNIIESLGIDDFEGADDTLTSWLSTAQKDAESSGAISATDLTHIAADMGFRVELSWARQYSQKGALDAVFHRCSPGKEAGARVLMQFPTDDPRSAPRALTNKPLQRLQSRRVEAQLRERIKALLPSYMMPTQIIALDQLPLNANGKVDRQELTRRAQTAPTAKTTSLGVAPRSEVEAVLCEEYTDVLGVEVGVTDNFFDLGGHSLMATKLAARVSRRLDTSLSVKDVFDQPVLADLAAAIRRGSSRHSPITTSSYDGPIEQSFAQGRLWFIDRLNPQLTWYLMPTATRMRGPLHVDALTAALRALEERHESLRTTFGQRDGINLQSVQPFVPKKPRIVDLSGGDDVSEELEKVDRKSVV